MRELHAHHHCRPRRAWTRWIACAAALGLVPVPLAARAPDAGLDRFRQLYRELVETNTTLSEGSCTQAAEKMRVRLIAAGYPAADARTIVPPGFPKQGNLVARLHGSDASIAPVLLVAHIDVVEAKASDWTRDPFRLVEENGYYHARGTVDNKAMAAAFVDLLVRFREEGVKPRRTIKLALTCGEETDSVFNGVQYLLKTEPETLRAGFAVNEGSKGYLDAAGRPQVFGVQAGEKIYQDFQLVATSPGGHSARPVKDNALVRLAAAITRLGAFDFPVRLGDVTRGYFARSAAQFTGQVRADMKLVGGGSNDATAVGRIAAANPVWNAMLRTTCIPTMAQAGHAPNAMPQRASVTINCRILPGETVEQVRARLQGVVRDPALELTLVDTPGPVSPPPALTDAVIRPVEQLVAEMWPGVPVVPSVGTGATDGRFLNAAGIPTYGISGMFVDPDGNGVHGLNERIRVRSLHQGRDFLYRLVKIYAMPAR